MHKYFFHTIKIVQKRLLFLTTTPYMRITLYIPFIVTSAMIILIAWQYNHLPPMIPIYYSKPWGEDQLAQKHFLFILPLGIFLWNLFTIMLIHIQTYHYRVFAQLLLITQSILSLSALYVLIRIILLMR